MQHYAFHPLDLNLTAEQSAQLKTLYAGLLKELEGGRHRLTPELFDGLRAAMRECLLQQPGFQEVWKQAETTHHVVHLRHGDNELLNLPWRLAVEDRPYLHLLKGLPDGNSTEIFQPKIPLPLKILVMISSPEDLSESERLSYEEEESLVISAFEPLFAHGQVEIDFTDDGSLESLQDKLRQNAYHILHFSGHGVFRDGNGYLLLEDDLTLNKQLVEAGQFAAALNVRPEHRPSLVLLSSCQTAQGTVAEGFRGVSNRLLESGVPAVIAMGFSILDYFATQFAAEFYRQLAGREHLAGAFSAGLRHIRQQEGEWLRQRGSNALPGQWMIPQLYATQQVVHLVDWQQPAEKLTFSSAKFATGQERLLLEARPGYLFIGRRRERREAMQHLVKNEPVLLQGQGGVGKTALAEHLAARLIARNPRVQPFVVDEKRGSMKTLVDAMTDFLRKDAKVRTIRTDVAQYDKLLDQFDFLLGKLEEKKYQPLFVFDNLESFQDGKGGPFLPQHADLLEVLKFIHDDDSLPLLCTARYPLPEFPDMPATDLNSVGYNDFHKKCERLALSHLRQQLDQAGEHSLAQKRIGGEDEKASFHAVVKLLHGTLGGNYRALEFFDELYLEKKDGIYDTLEKLGQFHQQILKEKTAVQERLQEGSKALVFSELLALLDEAERQTLQRLAQFRVPVLPLALLMQHPDIPVGIDATACLERLTALTLAERQQRPYENGRALTFYYVPPLVRDWLAEQPLPEAGFSQGQAGKYFEYMEKNVTHYFPEYEEAFHHYHLAGDRKRVNEIGSRLCGFFYEKQLFQNAFFYGKQTEALVGEETKGTILNILGLIYQLYGQPNMALYYFETNIRKPKIIGDRKSEGATLNNIGLLYKSLGNFTDALKYYQQSLRIMVEIGDRQSEGVILSNMGSIVHAQGDYPNALRYLHQSLKIQQEIENQLSQGTTLNNISQIYSSQKDYPAALRYLEQSLKIQQEIGDRKGEGVTLNNIGQIYSLQENYPFALYYLEQSLKIRQEIGDRTGEGYVIHNIAGIANQNKDFEKYLEYERRAYKIVVEIDDAYGIFGIGQTLGYFLCLSGQKDQGLPILRRSYDIAVRSGLPGAEEVKGMIDKFS